MSAWSTSSPVSASTFLYLIREPVFALIWLKLTRSLDDVAGYSATEHETRDSLRYPFQYGRGATRYSYATRTGSPLLMLPRWRRPPKCRDYQGFRKATRL